MVKMEMEPILLIFCEGSDDKEFINKFCNHHKIDKNSFDIQSLNNKSNFFKLDSYKGLKSEVGLLYNKILFILDADYSNNDKVYGGFENTKEQIQKIINELNFPIKTDYYIMCDPKTTNGNLEHLLLSTIPDKERECIEDLLKCISNKEAHSNKKIILTSYNTIFKEFPYNFNHKNFEKLKRKLEYL
jgi:hypothetical protein